MMPEPNWSYTVGGLTDERFFTERDVVGGAQVVGYNNAGYFRFAGTEVICELWWRPIFGSQFLAATKYHAPFLAGEPRYWWNGP